MRRQKRKTAPARPDAPTTEPTAAATLPGGDTSTPLAESLVAPATTVHDALEQIDRNSTKICLVVDDQRRLIGAVTDGDIRRGILRGVPIDASVTAVMNTEPHVLRFGRDRGEAFAHLRREKLRHLPVVDFAGRVVDVITLESLIQPRRRPNWVVVMAGGRGARLQPLTEATPKPMLDVGGRPLLETTIRNCAAAGFANFFVSVNYQAEVIKDHFGDGRGLDVDIRYLEEDQPLGTAGPLGLLPDTPRHPIVVINGDVLTKVDPAQVIAFHEEHDAAATMAVREHVMQVPYGVVNLDNLQINAIREKPTERYFINAGIYVLEPQALAGIQPAALDMPDLFDGLRQAGARTLAYPIREYWIDIGQIDDYRRANAEFFETFLTSADG